MSTWAGIVRVSHMGRRKQDAADFHSEREQVEAMQRAVADIGGALELLPSELDVSGGLPLAKRPSLLAAVEGVETGKYAGVVVAYQSRLGRDTEYEEGVWRRVEAAGGRIVMAMDGIDTTTVDGKMIRRIRSAMNHAERERHTERFDRLRKYATEAGIWQNRQIPRGYVRDIETRRLDIGPDAERVRAVFRARSTGEAYVTLAKRLGMTPTGVKMLLANRVYLGELHVGRYVNLSAHPAIVSVETFEAAQRKMARPPRSKSVAGPAMLTGLLRCSGCGHAMARAGSTHPVYRCPEHHHGERCPAPASITVRLIDAHVEGIALAELAKLHPTASDGDGIERAKGALGAAEREMAAYLDAVSAADVGADAFAAGAKSRRAAVDAARDQLQAELSRSPALPGVGTSLEAWGQMDAFKRNALLRSLLACVIVRRAGGRGIRVPLDERVRVLAHGTPVVLPTRGRAGGVMPIALPDFDQPGVLGVHLPEDQLEGAGGRRKVPAH